MDLSVLEPKNSLAKLGDTAEDVSVETLKSDAKGADVETLATPPALAKTPYEEWLEEIADAKVSREEVARIVDAILTKGYHEESYRVNKTLFTFRTRSTADADRTMELIHEQRPSSTAHYSHLVSRINTASSLSRFGSTSFSHTPPAQNNRAALDLEWKERYRFITALPAPVFYLLTQVLQRFDVKVALAGDARSIENF